jgi:hypothetical protein
MRFTMPLNHIPPLLVRLHVKAKTDIVVARLGLLGVRHTLRLPSHSLFVAEVVALA